MNVMSFKIYDEAHSDDTRINVASDSSLPYTQEPELH